MPDAPVIMGISKPAGLKSPCGEVKIVNPLFVGIDVSSKNNVAYLMMTAVRQHVFLFPRMEKRFMWFTGEQGMGNGRITALA